MSNETSTKQYDLEERTLEYAKSIIQVAKVVPHTLINRRLVDQLIRSSTSIGANYREANETETKKDFLFRMRIARKEAKETLYWLQLIIEANPDMEARVEPLIQETYELLKICAAIIERSR